MVVEKIAGRLARTAERVELKIRVARKARTVAPVDTGARRAAILAGDLGRPLRRQPD